jgi:hypothetical protein
MISAESIDCRVFNSREECESHGKDAIRYYYAEHGDLSFPEDVTHVLIMMPVTYDQAYAGKEIVAEFIGKFVEVGWAVRHRENDGQRNQWELSGTREKPTLSPSLFWLPDVWHGFLRNGRLESC